MGAVSWMIYEIAIQTYTLLWEIMIRSGHHFAHITTADTVVNPTFWLDWIIIIDIKTQKMFTTLGLWAHKPYITFGPRQNDRHFVDDIFKCISLNEDVLILMETSLKFVSDGFIENKPARLQLAWLKLVAWCPTGKGLNQWWPTDAYDDMSHLAWMRLSRSTMRESITIS